MKHINLIDKAFLLKTTHLFGNLDLDLLLIISDKMEMVSHKKGSYIFRKGHDATKMYLVTEGTIEILNFNGEQLALVNVGDFFGDESIFNERPRAYDAKCKTDVTVLNLSRSHLLSIISECPSVAIQLLEVYTRPINFRTR
ncbi:MAG: cyclic nucleotide-binding domain-containing protein [Chlamydiia bacterium]|nr:cyclic nucleotide-binding domain-containing protein [Chlamydiia bacterium]